YFRYPVSGFVYVPTAHDPVQKTGVHHGHTSRNHPLLHAQSSLSSPRKHRLIASKTAVQRCNFYSQRSQCSHVIYSLIPKDRIIEYLLQIPDNLQEKLENELFEFVEKEGFHMHAEKRDELPTSTTLVNVIRKLIEKGVIEEGDYEDGMKEGKEEAIRNFGKALINENYYDKEIMKLTILDLDEIEALRKSLQD